MPSPRVNKAMLRSPAQARILDQLAPVESKNGACAPEEFDICLLSDPFLICLRMEVEGLLSCQRPVRVNAGDGVIWLMTLHMDMPLVPLPAFGWFRNQRPASLSPEKVISKLLLVAT